MNGTLEWLLIVLGFAIAWRCLQIYWDWQAWRKEKHHE